LNRYNQYPMVDTKYLISPIICIFDRF